MDHERAGAKMANVPPQALVPRQSRDDFMTNSAKTIELTSDELDRVSGGIIRVGGQTPVVILKPQPLPPIVFPRFHRSGIA
ncbi:hypothetical protein LJR220_001512 [Bradyrhizobium sp. LjRoot220]|uniref:hypothetical protein n=1 Tax=Bradyrhizobium sp. LjRoot220 TaxID=3342284 RepID=UPI003ECC2BC9